ncbi:MAG: hypothetical protein J7501_07585 [Bdellovibrio sp.]|nr:hypothetical protein [Bdellovibrio sp.]
MDVFTLALSLFVALMALAVFTNKARAAQHYSSELTPNCLLTRWPLLFVTGPRSFFYFSAYWNIYPSYLAEHGYEVFHLRLPWNKGELRKQRLLEFLNAQDEADRKYHLIVDEYTLKEFSDLLRSQRPSCIVSLTEISDPNQSGQDSSLQGLPFVFANIEVLPSNKSSLFVKWCYSFHRLLLTGKHLPSLSALGACEDTKLQNGRLLLDRAQLLAEMDLRQG